MSNPFSNEEPCPLALLFRPAAYDQLIDLALREDLGTVDVAADLTAAWTVASDAEARARIIARQARRRRGY